VWAQGHPQHGEAIGVEQGLEGTDQLLVEIEVSDRDVGIELPVSGLVSGSGDVAAAQVLAGSLRG
jgi:hypothetical protein